MSKQTTAIAAEPLDVVARKIEAQAKKSDDHVIAAAMLMREALSRVDGGEAGKTTWHQWASRNIKLSSSRLYELQCIAEADDPSAELERLRRLIRERVKKHREKKALERRALEAERTQLIDWARKAPIEDVTRVLAVVTDNTALASNEERPALERQHAA